MASFSVPCPKCPVPSSLLGLKSNKILFQSGLSLKNSQSFGSLSAESASFGIQCLNKKQFPVKIQAQLNEAAIVENSNSAPNVASPKEKENQNGSVSGGTVSDVSDESAVSAFMSQVADLVILVDSRDIVELQLKQSDYELTIRKKEALQPPPATAMPQSAPPMYYPTLPSPPPPPSAYASAPTSSPPSKATPALPPPKTSASSHPPLKCPMAGTFYRCPGPGEPPFVKVGDQVQKGQVVCIIEAMKLMNEIEADKSGTIAEVLVEDGKPVSVGLSGNHINAIWAVRSISNNPHSDFVNRIQNTKLEASFRNSSMSIKGTSFQSRSKSRLLDSMMFDDVDFPLIRNLLSDIHRLI